MKALKRFTISVTHIWFDREQTDVLVATSDLESLMRIWDPFHAAS